MHPLEKQEASVFGEVRLIRFGHRSHKFALDHKLWNSANSGICARPQLVASEAHHSNGYPRSHI